MKKTSKVMSFMLVFALLITSMCSFSAFAGTLELEPDKTVDHSTYGWVTEAPAQDADHNVTIKIMEVPNFELKEYTTAYPLDNYNAETDVYEADAIVSMIPKNAMVEILFNAANEVIDIEIIEDTFGTSFGRTSGYNFDSMKYGGELTASGGGPGNMVAQGWILGKSDALKTITIGDGNHVTNVFEQTYQLADDCAICVVDNTYFTDGTQTDGTWAGETATFADIETCDKISGEIYYVPVKWTAVCIFDGNYTTADTAKVKELYLFKNPLTLQSKDLVTPDGMQYNGTSWYAAASKLDEVTGYSFNGSVVPFEVMADRLYSVGDAYTCIWLLVADDGSTTLVDQGNRTASYQYWLNIEKVGYDPREINNILLTHGHGDHYQALYENCTMINRYHNGIDSVNVITSSVDKEGLTPDGSYVGRTLNDKSILYFMDGWDVNNEWTTEYGDGGLEVYPFLNLGHATDVASFIFKLTATADDEYFNEGDVVSFCYMGGYGSATRLSQGYLRLAFRNSLMYIQSVIVPYMVECSDYIYNLPQHTNQYPWHEVWKASTTAGIPFMEGLSEGPDAIQNFCEKRLSTESYEWMYQDWINEEDECGNLIEDDTGFRCSGSSASYQTLEAYGPYKRPDGEYTIKVDSALVLHGFNAFMNPNEAFAGQTNCYGFDVANGFLIDKDSYTHDPDGWYVQIVGNVLDDYNGGVYNDDNWYDDYASSWSSGPIEKSITPDWVEVLRTVRLDSEEEAKALLATISNGGYYKVNLNMISDIETTDNLVDTFTPVDINSMVRTQTIVYDGKAIINVFVDNAPRMNAVSFDLDLSDGVAFNKSESSVEFGGLLLENSGSVAIGWTGTNVIDAEDMTKVATLLFNVSTEDDFTIGITNFKVAQALTNGEALVKESDAHSLNFTVDSYLAVYDVNGDSSVDIGDFSMVLRKYQAIETESTYDTSYDFNCDGIIDINDLSDLFLNFTYQKV
ncbi:MAG: MBL fold metallo-hydrolase [Oscillospiraceae bacterium]